MIQPRWKTFKDLCKNAIDEPVTGAQIDLKTWDLIIHEFIPIIEAIALIVISGKRFIRATASDQRIAAR